MQSRYISKRVDFFRRAAEDTATTTHRAVEIFDESWNNIDQRMIIVPGKEVLSAFRAEISRLYSVTLTDHRIVSAFEEDEVPDDLKRLLAELEQYRRKAGP